MASWYSTFHKIFVLIVGGHYVQNHCITRFTTKDSNSEQWLHQCMWFVLQQGYLVYRSYTSCLSPNGRCTWLSSGWTSQYFSTSNRSHFWASSILEKMDPFKAMPILEGRSGYGELLQWGSQGRLSSFTNTFTETLCSHRALGDALTLCSSVVDTPVVQHSPFQQI
jgi:hypothetical protein